MTIPLTVIRQLQSESPAVGWQAAFDYAWRVCEQELPGDSAYNEIARRDRELTALDLYLATVGWDLWQHFDASVSHTADALVAWWEQTASGKAVLILDALSLRETPLILHEATRRGYTVQPRVTAAELPADTTQFAKMLGFSQRSALANNGAGDAHRLAGARTDSNRLPWADCANLLGAAPNILLWHHYPDERLHDYAVPGQGLKFLADDVTAQFSSEDFWQLIERLTTGRRLLITSDHGYASTGSFADVTDAEQKKFLKDEYGGGRWARATTDNQNPAVPPLELTLQTRHGHNRFVLGRRKWSVQGGYPTLAHGGLSVLEVAVPFIELSR